MVSLKTYNPADRAMTDFLWALSLGETAHSPMAATMGVGGSDLSSKPRNLYGFPIWAGVKNSHAAGVYQYEPATWSRLAETYHLDWRSRDDQDFGAWMLAEQAYQAKTGASLYAALVAKNYSSVQTALGSTWPSVNGNAASPHGLAWLLKNGVPA